MYIYIYVHICIYMQVGPVGEKICLRQQGFQKANAVMTKEAAPLINHEASHLRRQCLRVCIYIYIYIYMHIYIYT